MAVTTATTSSEDVAVDGDDDVVVDDEDEGDGNEDTAGMSSTPFSGVVSARDARSTSIATAAMVLQHDCSRIAMLGCAFIALNTVANILCTNGRACCTI